jgi:hypothetical protein
MTTKAKLSPFEENLLPQHSIMKRLSNLFVELQGITDSKSNVKSYTAFTKVIQGLIDDLERDTKKHFEVLVEMTKKCTAEDEFRAKEVADARKAMNNADASRKVCTTHLNKAQTLLKVAINLLKAEEEKKRQRTEIRAQEHAIFVSQKRQYDDAIAFLRKFIVMVAQKFGGKKPAFIELSEELLRHTAKTNNMEAAVPVLILLSQYTSAARGNYQNFDGAAASKTLVAKLNHLLSVLQRDLDLIIKIENQRQADFNAFLIKVNRNIAELKANIVTLNAQISHNKECIARETKIFNTANAKSVRNDDLKARAIKMCAKFVEEVAEAQKARRTEVAVVRQILNLMNVRFGKVPKRMSDYLDNVENGFKEYENRTKLIAFQVYKHAAIKFNAKGADIVVRTKEYISNKLF